MRIETDSPLTWIYLRKSRDEEHDPQILAKHRSFLTRLAEADGRDPRQIHWYEEIGSADDISSRPEFVRLLTAWERLPRGHGGATYTTEVSRLTRGLQSQQGRVQDTLARAAILHRTGSRWFDLRQPHDATAWEMEGFLARMELRAFKWRVALAHGEMVRAGRSLTGKACFGYEWDMKHKTFVPVPGAFEILRLALLDCLTESLTTVATKYGIPRHVLAAAAKNPVVCGWPARRHGAHHGEKPWKHPYAPLPRDQWEWPLQPGDYEPAISREQWELLQVALERRRFERAETDDSSGWCRDVLRFTSHPDLKPRLGAYHCPEYSYLAYEITPRDGPRLYVRRDDVHAAAEAAIRSAVGARELRLFLASRQRSDLLADATPAAPSEATEALARELEKKERHLTALKRQETDPDTDPKELPAIRRTAAEIRQERDAIENQLRALQSRVTLAAEMEQTADLLAPLAEDWSLWERLEPGEKRACANLFLARIDVELTREGRRIERRVLPPALKPWVVKVMGEIR